MNIKKIMVGTEEIVYNRCNSLKYLGYNKEVKEEFNKNVFGGDLSLTHIKIIKLLNGCDNFKIFNGKDKGEMILIIENETSKYTIFIPQKETKGGA